MKEYVFLLKETGKMRGTSFIKKAKNRGGILMNYVEIIKSRKSVRTFDGRELKKEDRQALQELLNQSTNPFGIDIEFKFLSQKKDKLSSIVIVGAEDFVAGKCKKVPHAEEAFGYELEKFILKAWEMGIGSVFLAGTMDRNAFEKAMVLGENEVLPAVTPLGYPAKKPSVRENMMRKGLKADERFPFEELFFEEDFSKELSKDSSYAEALQMVRLAPSATNKQPWRIVVRDKKLYFYEKKHKGYAKEGFVDIQKVDMGIAMAHFELAAEELGIKGEWKIENPGLEIQEDMEYILTFESLT